MPHIDARSGEIVIRIVYDGAPEAGKTTNVHQLGSTISLQRRGAAQSPGTTGARTEFFDWLDFSGGYLDGRRVRCQLVSVPGQPRLLHRRRYLLERADAVVFVADSRPSAFEEATRNFATTQRLLHRVEGEVPIGLVIQANKQDLPEALAPLAVLEMLGADAATPVIGTVAATGEGVMQAFVLAAQLAIERARELLLGPPRPEVAGATPEEETPEMLHQQLLRIDAAEEARVVEPSVSEVVVVDSDIEETEASGEPFDLPPPRLNMLTRFDRLVLPNAETLSAGHVWPAVTGRASVADATAGPIVVPGFVQAWAPREPYEILVRDAWYLHSSPRWSFGHESDARRALLTQARKVAALGNLAPKARAIVVAKEDDGWRLYIATPRIATLAETALAVTRGEPLALRNLVTQTIAGWSALSAHDLAGTIALNQLAIEDGRLVLLAIPEVGQPFSTTERAPLAALWTALEERLPSGSPQRQWWNEEGRALLGRAAEEMP